MTILATCATCGAAQDSIVGDRVIKLQLMPIIQESKISEDMPEGFGSICICKGCQELLAFDIGAMIKELNKVEQRGRSNHDLILTHFFTIFIREVWGAPKPPTYLQIANVLNAAGIRTQTGARWEYHNVRQKMSRLGIELEDLHRESMAARTVRIPYQTDVMIEKTTAVLIGHKDWGERYVNPALFEKSPPTGIVATTALVDDVIETTYGSIPKFPGDEEDTEDNEI